MKTCYLCKVKLNKGNSSTEHIIPNAICGKLKSKKLLCKKCNNDMGRKIDIVLANQLNHIVNLLDLERDRNKPNDIDAIGLSTGNRYKIVAGGEIIRQNPIRCKDYIFDDEGKEIGVNIKILARDKKQAEGIINALQKEYKFTDKKKAELLLTYTENRHYLDEKVTWDIELGGKKSLLAISKIIINYYLYLGYKYEDISKFVDKYFNNINNLEEIQFNEIVFFYPDKSQDIIMKLDENEVLHSLIVKGRKDDNILYGMVELFNFYRVLVILNNNYKGPNFEEVYIYDVRNRKPRKRKVNLEFKEKELTEAIDNSNQSIDRLIKEYIDFMNLVQKKQIDNLIENITKLSIEKMIKKYPKEENEYITQEMISFLAEDISREWAKYLSETRDIK